MQVRDSELDRTLAEWLEDETHLAPSEPVEVAISHARAQPRRRDPFAFARRDAMTARTSSSGFRPMVILVAVAALLVLGVGAVALGVGRPSDSARATPTPQASETPYVAPGAGFRHPILAGDPLDAAFMGNWRPDTGYPTLAFYAAGSETCSEVFHTDQDCVALSDEDNIDLNRGTFGGGIVVMSDGKLLYDEVMGSPVGMAPANQPCFVRGTIEQLSFELDGDRLYLEPSGACWPNQNKGFWDRD